MTKYYYKTLVYYPKGVFNMTPPYEDIEKDLNILGEVGWELVSVNNIPQASGAHHIYIILKNLQSNLA